MDMAGTQGRTAGGIRAGSADGAPQDAALPAGIAFRLVAEPGVEAALLPCPPAAVLPLADLDPACVDEWLAQRKEEGAAPVVYVTNRPLATRRCAAVFGYANRRAQAAVASLAGLVSNDPGRTRRRMAAVAAHELGHLAGRGHCRTPGCLMRPASSPEELDARSLVPCDACRGGRRWMAAGALLAACLAASLLFDAGIEKIRNRTRVFAWSAACSGAALLLHGKETLQLRSPAAAAAAAERLNQLYASMAPPALHLAGDGAGARIEAGGVVVLALEDVEAGGVPVVETARLWMEKVDQLLQGKGPAAQGCPACHVNRRDEVLEAAARRAHWWRKP